MGALYYSLFKWLDYDKLYMSNNSDSAAVDQSNVTSFYCLNSLKTHIVHVVPYMSTWLKCICIKTNIHLWATEVGKLSSYIHTAST